MSNKPNTKSRQRPPASATTARPFWHSPLVWVGALLVLAAALAIVVTTVVGDDDVETDAGPAIETASVEIIGDTLPPFTTAVDDAAGMPIPIIATATSEGTRVQILADGTPRLIGLFAHWCSHCQREVPRTVAWLAANELPGDVELVAVSTAVDARLGNYPPSAWLAREGWPLQVLVDDQVGSIATALGMSGFPFWVAVGADGTVVARQSGELTAGEFEALLDAAATGEAPAFG